MRCKFIHQSSKLSVSLRMVYWNCLQCMCRYSAVSSTGLHTLSVLMMDSEKDRGGGRGRAPGNERRLTREAVIARERERYISMTLGEKRRVYKCGANYSTLADVDTWNQLLKSDKFQRLRKDYECSSHRADNALNDIITIWKGDITKLEIDAIANAANHSLLGGGGVDGAIHMAAGSALREECALLNGCDTGEAEITGGYNLPAKYVIHTVGPVGEKELKLKSCYQNCLRLLKEYKLRSLAFPCISTGIYGYPNYAAAKIALETTRNWLDTDRNSELVDRIVFCLFLPKDVEIYEKLMYEFFPPGADGEDSDPEGQGEDDHAEEDQGATAGIVTSTARAITISSDTLTASATNPAVVTDTTAAPTEETDAGQVTSAGDGAEDTKRTQADGDMAEEDQTLTNEETKSNKDSGDGVTSTTEDVDSKNVETAEKER